MAAPREGRAVVGDHYEEESLDEAQKEKAVKRRTGKRWDVSYDKLVVTVGCYSQTFGTPGVRENAYFMKDVGDARKIRKRVLECFEIANLPTTSDALRDQLLSFAIIGGGPTGMEFAAELSDLISEDLTKLYPELVKKVKIVVRDVAPTILSMFDEKLAKYAMKQFNRQGVEVRTSNRVVALRPGLPHQKGHNEHMNVIADSQGCYTLTTKEDGEMGVGMCVWSTGNMMNPFVQRALKKTHGFPSASATIKSFPAPKDPSATDWMIEKHPKTGAIIVDDRLRVQLTSINPSSTSSSTAPHPFPANTPSTATMSDVFALGDNATIRNAPLPATAQTASQQALWLAKRFNNNDFDKAPFTFKNLGIMTYLGNSKGLVQTGGVMGDISGRAAWLIWRGAYLTMSLSWRNKILISTYW